MKVIIIGGIAAGMSAAAKLKRMSPNDEVIVYEKGDIVSFGACGLPYYAGGFFDDSNEMIARTAEEFRKTGINLFTNHEVLEVDFDNKKLRVKDLIQNMIIEESYDKLMIASGASSIIPPIKGIDSENVLTLKSMDDGNKLRVLMENENLKRVTVIGAGFIGVEAVEAAKKRGKEVTVVQLQDRILAEVFDEEITNLLEEEIRKHDVNLLLDETVMEITTAGKATNIKTNKREFETDIVIVATGFRPNTAFVKNEKLEIIESNEFQNLFDKSKKLIDSARSNMGQMANVITVLTNFLLGRYIVEQEQQGAERAKYGAKVLDSLSSYLTEEYGRGFSRSNVAGMRQFYMAYKDREDEIIQSGIGQFEQAFGIVQSGIG